MPCSSCHFGGTSRLTEFGRDFQMRGHRLKIDDGGTPWPKLMEYLTVSGKLRPVADTPGAPSAASPVSPVQSLALYTGGPLSREISYFAEYTLYDRVAGRSDGVSGFLDGYVQYTGGAQAKNYWWVRSGRLYPFSVYALGAGGRTTLSRPRLVSDRLGGFLPTLQRRAFGVSGGYSVGRQLRLEAGIQRGDATAGDPAEKSFLLLNRPDAFATLEKSFDEYGSGIGLYVHTGWTDRGELRGDRPFTQTGLSGRLNGENFALTGAYVASRTRTDAGTMSRPDGYFLEAARNLQPELTSFVRYDNLESATAAGSPRTQGLALGVSQRLPGSGRAVLEWSKHLTPGARSRQSLLLDFVVMY